ncbi:ATP-grasp domain-containing protein [Shimazuella sp. AN120528]|uniref:ATP-grasp domain-containing protein n=1 Tax=Shimazuella soli TaxID=1892854 RepID=UPI001F1022AF|nr:ATP-grasp domain-containing protein [Shimazuella soli]MCH5584855.1 ATP-grasp domain-containing protein [Shimazuella soli]
MKIFLTSETRVNSLIEYGENMGHEFYLVKNTETISSTYPGIRLHSHDDWGSIISYLQSTPIDAVISICGNTPEQIALIRDGMIKHYSESVLGIPMIGHPLQSAMVGIDKGIMRQVLRKNSAITVAPGDVVTNKDEAAKIADQVGYPIILKDPTGSAGAKTAYCVTHMEIDRYFEMYRPSKVLIEKHIEGIEISIEVLSYKGVTVPFVPIYKGSTLAGGHPTERLKIAPYHLPESRLTELQEIIQQLGKLFHWEGITDIDLIIPQKGPITVLEVNTRFGGSTALTNLTGAPNTYHELVKMAMNNWKPPEIHTRYLSLQIPVLQHFTLQQSQQISDEFATVRRIANKILPSPVKSILTMSGPTNQVIQDIDKLVSLISIREAWKEFHEVMQSSTYYQELRG